MRYNTDLLRQLRLTIGGNINQRRRQQKLPLAKLSRLTGVPLANLDRYELGKSEIRLDEMLKIACALRVPVGSLIKL